MKDHQNWELLSRVGEALKDKKGQAIRDAVGEVEDQEDEHLYHTRGWARELWIESLGHAGSDPSTGRGEERHNDDRRRSR